MSKRLVEYKYTKVLPQAGSTSATIASTGGTQVILELPPSSFSGGDSVMHSDVTIAAEGTGNFTNAHLNGAIPLFNKITLATRAGVRLCEINDADKYQHLVRMYETCLDELAEKSTEEEHNTDMLCMTDDLASNNGLPFKAGVDVSRDYTNFRLSADGGDNTAMSYKLRVALKELMPNTVFSKSDNPRFWNETLLLTLDLNTRDKVGWLSTSATDPATGAGALTNNITLSNVYLQLAQVADETVDAQLKMEYSQGWSENILYPQLIYKNTQSGTSQSLSVQLNGTYGKMCKRIYTTLFNTDTNNLAYDHSTTSAYVDKVQSYNSYVDNLPNENEVVSVGTNDYDFIRKKLRGGIIRDPSSYWQQWAIVKDFSGSDSLCDKNHFHSGIELVDANGFGRELKYSILSTTASGSFMWWSVGIFVRRLSVSPAGINVSNA